MKSISFFIAACSMLIIFAMGIESEAASQKAAPALGSGTASADWQKKWDDTVAAAKKEGELLIYLNASSDTRVVLTEAFHKKFGLKLGVVMGSGEELNAKVAAEYRAGINQVDVMMGGGHMIARSKDLGIFANSEPMLILPEVREPRFWLDGKLPFFDKGGLAFAFLALKNPTIFYNYDLVKEGEITSHLDLLKPQWRGKTVMYDPAITGAGQAGAYFLTFDLGGNEKVHEYISAMIKRQETIVTRDMRQQVDWVARGKYPVALWPQFPATSQFLKVGAHLAAASIKEKQRIGSSNGTLGMTTKPAHPNAALVFLNWFLSREGQTLAVKSMGAGSARIDVPTEGINPIYIPRPGENCHIEDEETVLAREPFVEGLKKLFAELNK